MQRLGPHRVAIALQYIYFSATNVLGVDVRLELSVSISSLMGKNRLYIFAFSNPTGRSCNWHVHKPWLNQTNSDIPTPEYNVFSEKMSLWSHRLWKSTFWQEICHSLKLHKIEIAKRKLKTSHRWKFEPITCHVWDKPFSRGFIARPYNWFG